MLKIKNHYTLVNQNCSLGILVNGLNFYLKNNRYANIKEVF